jgi:hypothetical protein
MDVDKRSILPPRQGTAKAELALKGCSETTTRPAYLSQTLVQLPFSPEARSGEGESLAMRRTSFALLVLCVVTAAFAVVVPPAGGEQAFPYRAYVTADDVYVRSGPGKSYYPTDRLKEGQVVEVYRHDPGGWCAIRPPGGSFTWVSTRFLRPAADGLAQVTTPNVAARVGARFSDIRDVIQVRLHQDELVEPLDGGLSGDRPWTRIAPPSGEFRWINSQYLNPEYPADGVQDTGRVRLDAPSPAGARLDAPHADGPPAPPDQARRAQPRPLSPEDYQRRLDEIDLGLSVMVAEEPTVWQFDEMALEAEHLLAQADTALERGRARLLLSKIDRFENIKQRYDAVDRVVADTDRRDRRLAELSTRLATSDSADPSGRFDGRGRLTRVRDPKPGAPRYALVDRFGNVTCYVTPSPGMSLRHYEQRTVGVTGSRGYVPGERTPHIMAQHIDVLSDRQLR